MAGPPLVFGLDKAVRDVELVHIVSWVVAQRKMRCLRAPVWDAPANVASNRDRVKYIAVFEHFENHAHVGKLT